MGKLGGGPGHRERRGPSAVLRLDDLITTILDALYERIVLLAGADGGASGCLGEEGDDGHAGMAAHDGHGCLPWVGARDAAQEARGADDVERGNAEEPARVEGARLLEDLGDDGHGRVDWVGNDEDVRVGRVLADCLCEVAHDGRVGVEEVVAGHPGLAWYTRRDHDDLDVLEGGV